jgi:hypothetical protein
MLIIVLQEDLRSTKQEADETGILQGRREETQK